jgi:hypothetical protein
MLRAIDVSNYSGPFGPEAVACWRRQGFDHIVCGTQRATVTLQQLEAALAGGMSIAAYVYLYWAYDIAAQVQAARETVAGYPIERLWLDCEDEAAGRGPDEIVRLIGQAVAACGETPHGIYTGRWWWVPHTGNSTAFARLPLWHAEYTASPGLAPGFDDFRAYGGWTRPVMWQYQGTTWLCGVSVDLNLREPVAGPTETVPPAGLVIEERRRLDALSAAHRLGELFTPATTAFGRPRASRKPWS